MAFVVVDVLVVDVLVVVEQAPLVVSLKPATAYTCTTLLPPQYSPLLPEQIVAHFVYATVWEHRDNEFAQ